MIGQRISIILPTYKEASSIVRFLTELIDVMKRKMLNFEIVLADDASPDQTADVVEKHFGSSVRVVRRKPPRGLAFSILDGVHASTGEVLVVMDADFNHDPYVVPYLVKYLDDFDLVSGSRFAPGGGMYSQFRHHGSFVMNLFLRVVLHTQIQDNLCGFFSIRRKQFDLLPADKIFWGHGDYYFRLLFYAQRRGLHILEIPAVYRSREGGESKTPLLRTSFKYLKEIIRLRLTYQPPEGGDNIALMRYDAPKE